MVNKVNIQIMIDTFKRLYKAPLPEHPDKGFNMYGSDFSPREHMQHNCGTAACIIGWVKMLFNDRAIYATMDRLDLHYEQYRELTHPNSGNGCKFFYDIDSEKFTLEAAIRVLQILRDEGIVDWNRAIENPWSPDEEQAKPSITDILLMETPPVDLVEGPKRIFQPHPIGD